MDCLFLDYGTIIYVTIHFTLPYSLHVNNVFKFSLDLISSCLFSFVKLVFAGWLIHQDYRVINDLYDRELYYWNN